MECTKEERLEKLQCKKQFFIKSFIVSFILLVVVYILALLSFDLQAILAEKMFEMDADDYGKILITAMAFWKILIIQFTLVPAIVLHCMEKHVKEKLY